MYNKLNSVESFESHYQYLPVPLTLSRAEKTPFVIPIYMQAVQVSVLPENR